MAQGLFDQEIAYEGKEELEGYMVMVNRPPIFLDDLLFRVWADKALADKKNEHFSAEKVLYFLL